jgi:hypothetical protein
MREIVPGFEHRPGVHCGSTAMADALRTVGIDLSEAMAFGLGSGPHFVILEGDGLTPSTMFFGRSATYERDLCHTLGVSMDETSRPTFNESWGDIRGYLRDGRPVLLVTDIKYLPHFNGHRVVLAGVDDDARLALVADTHFPGLCEVPLDAVRSAMESDAPPVISPDCTFAVLNRAEAPADLHHAARQAVRSAAAMQLEDGGFTGVAGVERLARSIARWPEREDRSWCARFGYQVIERRGTGGGLFRKLYTSFLREAGETFRDPELAALAPLGDAAATAWTVLALQLKAASEGSVDELQRAQPLAEAAAEAERALWTAAAAIRP